MLLILALVWLEGLYAIIGSREECSALTSNLRLGEFSYLFSADLYLEAIPTESRARGEVTALVKT